MRDGVVAGRARHSSPQPRRGACGWPVERPKQFPGSLPAPRQRSHDDLPELWPRLHLGWSWPCDECTPRLDRARSPWSTSQRDAADRKRGRQPAVSASWRGHLRQSVRRCRWCHPSHRSVLALQSACRRLHDKRSAPGSEHFLAAGGTSVQRCVPGYVARHGRHRPLPNARNCTTCIGCVRRQSDKHPLRDQRCKVALRGLCTSPAWRG